MSINNSHAEYLYLLYIKLYPDKFFEALNVRIDNIFLEKKYVRRKVDISGYDVSGNKENGRRCLIEVQLIKSNNVHLKQIKNLIFNVGKGNTFLVWIAKEFRESDLVEIKNCMDIPSENNIEFIAYTLNENVIKLLEEINKVNIFEQIEMLGLLDSFAERHFSFVESIKRYNSDDTISAEIIDNNNVSYTHKQQILIKTLNELRRDFVNYPNVHQCKVVENTYLSLGLGFEDIDFRIVYNKRGLFGVEVIFSQAKTKKIFSNLYCKRQDIEDRLDFLITKWDVKFHKIATYVNPYNYTDMKHTVKMIARIAKRYIYVFNEYIQEEIKNEKQIL